MPGTPMWWCVIRAETMPVTPLRSTGSGSPLQSIPSGIFNPHIKNVMANGMVVNPVSVVSELEALEARGIREYNSTFPTGLRS